MSNRAMTLSRGRPRHSLATTWLIFFLAISACGPETYLIDVEVNNVTDEVVRLVVSATVGNQKAESTVSSNLSRLSLRLLSITTLGRLDLQVSAVGADGCQVSAATTQAMVPADGPISITLTEKRGCRVVLQKIGEGRGQVKTLEGGWSCSFDPMATPDPKCKTDLPGACTYCQPLGSKVTFSAAALGDLVPRSYFAGWTGACAGQTVCQLPIGQEELNLGAGFLPTQACSKDQFCWEHPVPQGNRINGIWGTASDDIWLVGGAGTILHWNGSFLIPVSTDTDAILRSVWGSGPNDIWATGASGTILHYDGKTWTPFPSPSTEFIYGLWGSGPQDVWAVSSPRTVLHYDGVAWSQLKSDFPDFLSILDVWGSGPNDVWFGGTGGVVHYDGASFSQPIRVPAIINKLWGTSPKDIWGIGVGIVHYDGATWSQVTSPTMETLFGVAGTGPSDVWAGGYDGNILHYDGKSWQVYDKVEGDSLAAMWASSAGDVWASGQSILRLNALYFIHQDGARTPSLFRQAWGTGANDAWVVGSFGAIMHYNGVSWTLADSGVGSQLYGVWTDNPHQVWAVGEFGTILYYEDLIIPIWTAVRGVTTQHLSGVWGSAQNDVWIVGEAIILHYDGASWTQTAVPGVSFTSVWGSGANDVWAVGSKAGRGFIQHYDGTSWVTVTSPSPDWARIWGSGPNDLWLVSPNDKNVYRSADAGANWIPSPVGFPLTGVWGSGANDVWIVGYPGKIFHWDGSALSEYKSGTSNNLTAVWGSGPGDVIVVGSGGTIIRRRP